MKKQRKLEPESRPLVLPFGIVKRTITGGPFKECPKDYFGIKLAPEVKADYNILLPIPDFSVPESSDEVRGVLQQVIRKLSTGRDIYVGCMGGRGRTGLFLALLVKALGVSDPIIYVRDNYNEHAVETFEQEQYVESFDVSPLFFTVLTAKTFAVWANIFGLSHKG